MDNQASKSMITEPASGGEVWPEFGTLVVDVGPAMASHTDQDALTDFILYMLERDYQIYLCSSSTQEGEADTLGGSNFQHPRLTWLVGAMPPTQQQLERYPDLGNSRTLWVSDDVRLTLWAQHAGAQWLSLAAGTSSFAETLHLGSWGVLGALLDPTARAVRLLVEAVLSVRVSRPKGAVIVGLGGPPGSEFHQIALDLKRALEAQGFPLVEAMDLTPLLEAQLTPPRSLDEVPAGGWLLRNVFEMAYQGKGVFIERAPEEFKKQVGELFPLYINEESIVLVLGETVFQRPLRDRMHLSLLIEVSPEETARRLYEIPAGEPLDPAFVAQYLERDGRLYAEYLKTNNVVERADVRINGSSAKRIVVGQAPSVMN
jgi:hypothetical protein